MPQLINLTEYPDYAKSRIPWQFSLQVLEPSCSGSGKL